MSLRSAIKFQKTLALAASASNPFEAEAAELAARRLMAQYKIDPTNIPNGSLYSRLNFANNALLKKLRDEWREAHPDKIVKNGRAKRRPNTEMFKGVFELQTGNHHAQAIGQV